MSDQIVNVCWICTGQWPKQFPSVGDNYDIDCPRCGRYVISRSLYSSTFPLLDMDRHRMSFWCRQRVLDIRETPHLTSYSIKAVVAELPRPRPSSKADLLLLSLSKLFPEPGEPVSIDWNTDYPLACAREGGEIKFHFRALKERGYVAGDGSVSITLAGWERIEQLQSTSSQSKVAFVALHFTDEMLEIANLAMRPAIERAGFEAVLANLPEHNERIDAKIITDIKRSRFVVADVTGARTGVYFEAGYAMGRDRPVIWTCRETNKQDMHFDTRQYNHVLWKGADDLREQLYYRIVATI